MKTMFAFLFVAVLGFVSGCNTHPAVNLAAEEAAIRATDANWLTASAAHDLERVLPFWTDDATIILPGEPAITGKAAIRKYVTESFATPGFSISWKTDKLDIAKSGDLAYSYGTDRISLTAPDGKTIVIEGRGLVIWKKQPDGSWKCAVDIMSPAPSAAPVTK